MENKPILSAEEFLKQTESSQGFGFTFPNKIQEMMKQFAKLHVEAALQAAADSPDESDLEGRTWGDRQSILSAYPLDKIV